MELKDKQGKVVGSTEVPFIEMKYVKPNAGFQFSNLPKAVDYLIPPFGQAGRPVSVSGPFEGDFNNTKIKVGDQTAQFLAESPRKVVVRSPANVTGPTTMEVTENGRVVARCNYQSISVRLSAEKLNLIRGEQTTLTATLSGLNGATGPVSFQLTNASPWTVRMEGGESQVITASPESYAGGVFTAKRTLTGVKAGGFSINAVVDPAKSSPRDSAVWKTCPGTAAPTDGGLISGNLNGSPDKPGDAKKILGGPPPKFDSNGKPIRHDGPGGPVLPFHARFRVTLNGFFVNHQTNQGLFAAWDAVTFIPSWAVVNVASEPSHLTHRIETSTIGSTPGNRNQGGRGSARGGLITGDGYPTQTPWQRTVPINASYAPATIPPTVYFEGEIIQNTTAAYIIPTIWVVDSSDDLLLTGAYARQISHDLPALGQAVARIIRGPQPLALDSYLRSGASMGLNNTMRLAIGVPNERPIGMQPERDQFGFIPQVLVLTYDSADFMSRTDFGFGVGVVPVRYVDPQAFAGDYTMYFQVERVDN